MKGNNIPEDITAENIANKKIPTIWKWYFGLRPRAFLTIPIFVFFVSSALWYLLVGIRDIILLFPRPNTLGTILSTIFSRTFLYYSPLLIIPSVICFSSIGWLYHLIIGQYAVWKKALGSIGIILIVSLGPAIIIVLTRWFFVL